MSYFSSSHDLWYIFIMQLLGEHVTYSKYFITYN